MSETVLLVDTSVAVPFVAEGHAHHASTFDALRSERLGLSGHAAFETFSVLTRLPVPDRRGPAVVCRLLQRNFPAIHHLPEKAAADLLGQLPGLRVSGGAVYDALVGATAVAHGLRLVSRDARAISTYRALGVDLWLLQ